MPFKDIITDTDQPTNQETEMRVHREVTNNVKIDECNDKERMGEERERGQKEHMYAID